MNDGYLRVGVTRSGREISVSFVDELDIQLRRMFCDFSKEDVFDAFAVFEYLLLRTLRREEGENGQQLLYAHLSRRLLKALKVRHFEYFIQVKSRLRTSIDIVNYGSRLVSPEFRDEM